MKNISISSPIQTTVKLIVLSFSLLLISACTPHPGAGIWMSSTTNDEHITKVSVFFEPTVKIYSSDTEQAILECGWWALNKTDIEMECVHLPNTETKVKYQLNVVEKDKAELFKQGKLVTTLTRKIE